MLTSQLLADNLLNFKSPVHLVVSKVDHADEGNSSHSSQILADIENFNVGPVPPRMKLGVDCLAIGSELFAQPKNQFPHS